MFEMLRLGSFAWELPPWVVRLVSSSLRDLLLSTWEAWLGNFRLGIFAWELLALGSLAWGTQGKPGRWHQLVEAGGACGTEFEFARSTKNE